MNNKLLSIGMAMSTMSSLHKEISGQANSIKEQVDRLKEYTTTDGKVVYEVGGKLIIIGDKQAESLNALKIAQGMQEHEFEQLLMSYARFTEEPPKVGLNEHGLEWLRRTRTHKVVPEPPPFVPEATFMVHNDLRGKRGKHNHKKAHKPNTGFKLGSYRYKSSKKYIQNDKEREGDTRLQARRIYGGHLRISRIRSSANLHKRQREGLQSRDYAR